MTLFTVTNTKRLLAFHGKVIKDHLISNLAYTHLTAADITSGTASDRVHGCVTSNDTTQFRCRIRYRQQKTQFK